MNTEQNQLHHKKIGRLIAFAIDHRHQFLTWAKENGRDKATIEQFKKLAWQAASTEASYDPGFGMLIDDQLGRSALKIATSSTAWIGRPIEASGKFPLEFETQSEVIQHLADWPLTQTVKVLCPYRIDDDELTRVRHEQMMLDLDRACRHTCHQWLLEIITSRNGGSPEFDSVAGIMQRFYDIGIKPNWWKIEPAKNSSYWKNVGHVIEKNDPNCQGIIVLGLDGTITSISESFKYASQQPWVKGFAIGRTLFSQPAQDWLAGNIDDATAVTQMRTQYRTVINAWDTACAQHNKG